MRKYHKKQILEIVDTIKNAHAGITEAFLNNQKETAVHILSECQECVTSIISFISELEGNDADDTIHLLENYYKLIYEISINTKNNTAKISKLLNRKLIEIERSIQSNIKINKFEILFLPYKVSMWDSLESIWMTAKDDPECNVFVMPIPYYNKRPDKSLGEMQFEGYSYPEYVPTIDWQKYNIEERRPDIIFTHNPYDGINHVTQVHHDFFSKRLRNLTDMLVYIPYFVCYDDVPSEFCLNPGSIYSNKVIVQSDQIKKTYISEYKQFEKGLSQKINLGKADEKFIALGSPKFDKILNAKVGDYQIPDDWRKLIEKPDGSRKKIVFYNTTIRTLLAENESFFSKLQYVFKLFKDRDDIVLLWRPHPLSIATYGAIRPRLLDDYLKIVENYIAEGWGIYDTSDDISRAIVISDAYYGDSSSIAPLYQCTGKPIMIQDIKIHIENTLLNKISFIHLHDDGESFWFTAINYNSLFRMDKQTWEVEHMGYFPNENLNGRLLFLDIHHHDGKLYFSPFSANNIAVYEIATRKFSTITFSHLNIEMKPEKYHDYKFGWIVKYNQYLFFLAYYSPVFLRYNLNDGTIDYFDDWVKPLEELELDKLSQNSYFTMKPVTNGSYFIAAASNANAVVLFDMDNCTSTVYQVGSRENQYAAICFDGKYYWMPSTQKGSVVKWSRESGECKEYSLPTEYIDYKMGFFDICYLNGHVWLFPYKAKTALKINVLDESITIVDIFSAECKYEKTDAHIFDSNYLLAKTSGDTIYALTGKTFKLMEYNTVTGSLREQSILLPKEIQDKIHSYALYNGNISLYTYSFECYFYEGPFTSLHSLLGYIQRYEELEENMKIISEKQIDLFKKSTVHSDGSSGSAIFLHCKHEIINGL